MGKLTVDSIKRGKLYNKQVYELTEKASEELSVKTDLYIRSKIKDKPRWFPFSNDSWRRLACHFLKIEIRLK